MTDTADVIIQAKRSNVLTGFVVGINEGNLLPACLQSLSFCSELIYVDLQSKDDSLRIAESFGAKTTSHEPVPYAEFIQSKLIPTLTTEWVLLLDPDERIDPSLALEITEVLKQVPSDVGSIRVPTRFYFRGKALKGTPWGHRNSKPIVFRVSATNFSDRVHRGRDILSEFREFSVPIRVDNTIHHYWMDNWKQLVAKHVKYLQHEGRSQQSNPPNWAQILISPLKEFYISFFKARGYLDGATGLSLSLFWSWYQTSALLEKRRHSSNFRS